VKIIDYKSGNKTFSFPEVFYGLQLQLIVYMDAFIKKFKEKFPGGVKNVLPAAVLYFRLDNPLLNFSEISRKDTIAEALYKKFKMSGVVLNDIDILKKLDSGIESKSDIIPAGVKSSGIFKKLPLNERPLAETSSALSEKDFQTLMMYSINKAAETGEKILSGDVKAAPYQYGNASGCAFFGYHPVCRFDAVTDAKDVRVLPAIKPKEALHKILIKGIDKIEK
jgi:ATP-dependent helicase/nuclease subunit B